MDTPFVVPVVFFVMIGLTVILRGPLGQAIAERIRHGAGATGNDRQLREDVDSLRLEVDELRGQLAEAHERIDFAERMLARRDEPNSLPQPKS
jgi:hypothetical protein